MASPPSNCTFEHDNAFGPAVQTGCRGGFDFTLTFEHAILTLLPAVIFSLVFLARFVQLARSDVKTVSHILRRVKFAASLLFVAVQVALVVLHTQDGLTRTALSLTAAAINLVVSLQFVALSWIEDSRSVRPSTPLLLYLCLTILLDLAQGRSLWLLGTNSALAGLFSAQLGIKVTLLALEAQQRRSYLKQDYAGLSPESTSGIISRSFLWWINLFLYQGFSTLIFVDDLFELDDELRSAQVAKRLQQEWEARQKPERRFELVMALCRTLWWPLLQAVAPRLCFVAFSISQPLLISSILDLVSGPADDTMSTNKGYGLIGATFLVYVGIAISNLLYFQIMNRCVTMSRGALVALIYERALLVPDGLYDESTAITLMSSDTALIGTSMERVHDIWAYTAQVAIGVYLLARQLGWVCVMPLLVVVVTTIMASKITLQIAGHRKTWVNAVQKRVGITSVVLSEMKNVRMMGLDRLLTDMIQTLRVQETDSMAKYRWNIVWKNVISNACYYLAPPATFAAYGIQAAAQGTGGINTSQAFASLSIIGLVTTPFLQLMQVVPQTAAGFGSFDRIQQFLLSTPRRDQRQSLQRSDSSTGARSQRNTGTNTREDCHYEAAGVAPDLAISLENVDLRPTPEADIVLSNVNCDIPRGSIAMVIGSVASGKSTLLKSILGEAVQEKGTIRVADGRIAYCGQTPWLPNTTIRKAITGPVGEDKVDERWYETCIRACALDRDFNALPDRDQTSIGSGTTTLSGGQKHRVALARAVYARARNVALDSVLSALDNDTKNNVAEALFGQDGLFRQIGSTVIFVTHTFEHLRYADQVLVLANGELKCHDNRSEATHMQMRAIERRMTSTESQTITQGAEKGTNTTPKRPLSQTPNATTTYQADLKRKTGDLSLYRYYLRSVAWTHALVYLAFVLLEVFGIMFSPIWLKMWSDVNGAQVGLYAPVYVLLPFLTLIGLGGFVWSFLIVIAPSSSNTLHFTLLRTVMRAPQSFFSITDAGSLLNRFSQDMTLIESALPTGAALFFEYVIIVVAQVALIASGSVYMTATIPVMLAAMFFLQNFYLRTSRQLRFLDLEAKSPLYSHFLETLNGLATIRAFRWGRDSRAESLKLLDRSQRPSYLLQTCQKWLELVLALIVSGEAVLIVGIAVGLRRFTNPGLLGVSLVQIMGLEGTLTGLVSGWTSFETSLGAIARIRDLEQDVVPEDKARENAEPPADWPDRGAIEFRNVTASHNPTAVALHDVSITIKPGQRVGICGRSGSGKSSFIATMLGLLEMERGSITIDQLDLSTIPRDTVRERLVTMPQDPLILVGSVRFNVDPHGRATDADIINALSDVGLWVVFQERDGLDSEVTGSSLSKGQQQLLSLARAMLQRGKIILLDEPTSNVDTETDAVIQRLLRDRCADRTIIKVAHRVDTILDSDVVIVLEQGRVVEVGDPATLLEIVDGRFGKLATG